MKNKEMLWNAPPASRQFYCTLFVCIVLVVLIFRIAYSIPIEISIDTISRWYVPTIISRTWEWSLLAENVWTSRWGITVPQVLVSYLMPGRIEGYYILPLSSYCVATATLSLILAKFANIRLSLILTFCVLVTIDPLALARASQLSEQPVGLFYVVVSLFCFLSYIENNRILYLIIAVVLSFCAYGVHILFGICVVPLLFVLLVRQQYKLVILSIVIYGFLLLFENFGFYWLSEGRLTLGRLTFYTDLLDYSRMHSVKDQLDAGYVEQNIWYTLSRWIVLPKFNQFIVFGYLIGCVFYGYLTYRLKSLGKPVQLLLILLPLTYAIQITFLPKSVASYLSLLDLTDKYTLFVMPFAVACTCEIVSRFCQSDREKKAMDIFVVFVSGLGLIVYIVASHHIRCGSTLWQDEWKYSNVVPKMFCSSFRISRGPNVFPLEPTGFVVSAQSTYNSIYRDYYDGLVGVPREIKGFFWLAVFDTLDENRGRALFEGDFLSSDGLTKDLCLHEITTQKLGRSSYVKCAMVDIVHLEREEFNVLIDKTVLGP